MDATTKMQVDDILKKGWYRKGQTLGEGGWAKIYSSGYDWKSYALFSEDKEGYFEEVETILAKDDVTAIIAFNSLYHLGMFDYWEIQERITEYRLLTTKEGEEDVTQN